ncbi:FK506-binding protein-like [Trichomycterus rosablanca]|uniref:FK506-binding protein-like n=1 Tax=Trichomycterus rosablanca TaxID=2290929 RepID=UPI002F3553AB
MATTSEEGVTTWVSVSPAGLWEVQRKWIGQRKGGDHTPLLGSICKILVSLQNDPKQNTQPQTLNKTEPVVSSESVKVTEHPRSPDSVLQVPLDSWVLLRMGEGHCDIIEACLEGMRAGETGQLTVNAYQGNFKPVCSDAHSSQSENTAKNGQSNQCFLLHLHSFTPGMESWQMSPTEKWGWALSHKQRGSQRFSKGDIWGAAHSYCSAVKLVITLKGHTRDKKGEHLEVNKCGNQDSKDLTTQNKKEEMNTDKELIVTQVPTEEEYRTMKAELHSNLSLCQLKLGQPAKAKDSSRKATVLDPASIKAWYRFGQACLQLEDFEESRQAFGKVLELQPDSASAQKALKQVNIKAKEFNSKLGQRLSKMFM